jgi:rubrerythrin
MSKLQGTQTEKNLLKSFAGESQARNRYDYFAGQAKKEGFEYIAKLFSETALQEKEHAKRFFSFLEGGLLEIQASFPAGCIKTTIENLEAAAAGEHEEHSKLYPEFSAIALAEGFSAIAHLFNHIAIAEKQHERQFRAMAEKLKQNKYFRQETKVVWRCLNCGYIHEGMDAPKACPACAHPQAYFEVFKI